mgnify:CR=1 FL=1
MSKFDIASGSTSPAFVARPIRRERGRLGKGRRPRLEGLERRLALAYGGTDFDLQAELKLASPAYYDAFGWSISATADGDAVAVGAPGALDPALGTWHQGSVTVFRREEGAWSQDAVLKPPLSDQDAFIIGREVAISGDGDVVVSTGWEGGEDPPFRLYVFEREAGSWSFRQSIELPPSVGATRGWPSTNRISISGDGGVIALGTASGPAEYAEAPGSVRLFSRGATGEWALSAELTSPGPWSDETFGASVGLSADGATLAVGAGLDVGDDYNPGAVYVYHAVEGQWLGLTTIGFIDYVWALGERLSISDDGRTILASGRSWDGGGWQQGTAYVFEEMENGGWNWVGALVAPYDSQYESQFGLFMDLSPDGKTVVASGWDESGSHQAAFVYTRVDGGWSSPAVLAAPGDPTPDDSFAASFAVADDDVFVQSDPAALARGADSVFVYRRVAGPEILVQPSDATTTPETPVTFLAAAGGAGVSVRWQVSADNGSQWEDVPGAIHDWYTVASPPAVNGNLYRAVYTDAQGGESVTRAARLVVAEATPVVTVDVAPNPTALDDPITFTVRVSPQVPGGASPSGGRITLFFLNSIYYADVVDGVAVIAAYPAYYPGTFAVRAGYDGANDPRYLDAAGSAVLVVEHARPEVDAALAVPDPYYGQPNRLDVRLEKPGDVEWPYLPSPSGLISLWDGAEYLGSAPLAIGADGAATASVPFAIRATGLQWIRWTYSGDEWYAASSTSIALDLDRAPTTLIAAPISGSPISYYGQGAYYRIQATGPGGAPAAGTVRITFPDDAAYNGGTYTLGRDGTLDVVLSTERRPGAHRVTFDFDGTTAAGIATYTTVMGIYKAPTTVEVAAGVWTQELGVTFTATVANAESWIAPTSGVVQFYVDNALMGEAIVGHDHVARWTTKALPLGVRTVVAVYRESANFQASQSAPIQVPIVPRRIETTTTLTSSANPAAPGERLTYFADVAGANGEPRPTAGLVRFYVGLRPIVEVPIDASGRAGLFARFDAAGSYTMTAVYLGMPGFQTSQSAHLNQVVAAPVPARVATTATATPSTVSAAAAAAEEARVALTPAQARRAAFAARLAARRSSFRPMRG